MKKFIANLNLSGVSKGTVLRTILIILAMGNYILTATGHKVIVINESDLDTLITAGFTVGTVLVGFWKNNSFTAPAQEADKSLKGE